MNRYRQAIIRIAKALRCFFAGGHDWSTWPSSRSCKRCPASQRWDNTHGWVRRP